MDLERIIANGLANIPEGPSPEGQAVENMDELVRTDGVDLTADRQLGELQIKPEIRIEWNGAVTANLWNDFFHGILYQ